MDKIDFHNGEQRRLGAIRRLTNSNIPPKEVNYIQEYISHKVATDDISEGRQAKLIDELRIIRLKLHKPFYNLTINDVKKYIGILNKTELAWETKKDYRQVFKSFIKWLWKEIGKFDDYGNKRSYPKEVAFIGSPHKETERNKVCRDNILEEHDILKLINQTRSTMWKAFFWILWEAGLRPSEILNLRVGNIIPSDNGITINVQYGKTGARKLPLIQSRQPVLLYLDNIETKSDDLLFPITYHACLKRCDILTRRTNITGKKTGLKYWRKARATYLSKYMTNSQLQYWFGWASAETSRSYVASSMQDVEHTMLTINSLAQEDNSDRTEVKFRTCMRCSERNFDKGTYCVRCGYPLTPEGIKKLEDDNILKVAQMVLKVMDKSNFDDIERIRGGLDNIHKN